MKAVILAAGLSRRLQQVTNGLPKTLLDFGGRTILDRQIDSLFAADVSEIAIVVGHAKERITGHISERYAGQSDRITFIENPRYAETNNIYSLWAAREWVGDSGFVCLNADVLYHPGIIVPALKCDAPITVIVDPEFRDETMKVLVENGKVTVMRKGIPREKSSGTYIGITVFSQAICERFFAEMQRLIDERQVDVFFNVAVEGLIADGVTVTCTSTGGLPWAEVDDPADLEFARSTTLPALLEATAKK